MRSLRYCLLLGLLAIAPVAGAVDNFPFTPNNIGLDAFAVFQSFVESAKARLVDLDEQMTRPCVPASGTVSQAQQLFREVQLEWGETLHAQEEAFNNVMKEAERAYGKYLATKGGRKAPDNPVRRRFRNEKIYTDWYEPSRAQWNWLFAGSAVFFKVVKRFEAQSYLNGIGVKNAISSFKDLQELCRELHDALKAGADDPSKENVAACEALSSYPSMLLEIWNDNCKEIDKFSTDRKPANYTEDIAMIHSWILDQGAFCGEYKTKWIAHVNAKYALYKMTFTAVETAWAGLRSAGYMHQKMPLFHGCEPKDLQGRYDSLMRDMK